MKGAGHADTVQLEHGARNTSRVAHETRRQFSTLVPHSKVLLLSMEANK